MSFYAFDLLELDGEDWRPRRLEERKAKLEQLLAKVPVGIQYSEHLEGDGAAIFSLACGLGAEGIVSKHREHPYRSGPSKAWLKIKNPAAPGMLRFPGGAVSEAPDPLDVTSSPPLAPGTLDDGGRVRWVPSAKRAMRFKTMPDIVKPLAKWTDEELAERARTYPRGDPLLGDKLTAEIDQRRAGRILHSKLWIFVFTGIAAFGVAAIVSVLLAFHLMSAG